MIENYNTEFKRTVSKHLEKVIIGFLNTQGGDIYIGLDDDGTVLGVENPDLTQLQIVDRIKNNISPNVLGLYDIKTIQKENKYIIHIIVSGGRERPYHLKEFGMVEKGCFIRVGSSIQQMSTDMISEQFRTRIRIRISNTLSPKQNLTHTQLKIYYDGQGYDIQQNFLENLELYTEDGKFNYLAYLLADNNRMSVRVAKYRGKDKVDLIENEEYGDCSIIKACNKVLEKIEIENKTFAEITSTVRKETKLMDSKAVREAVINAFVHTDYTHELMPIFEFFSDRLTITSYGSLPYELTEEDFFKGKSFPRNRELMRVFKDLDLVEQLGSGMNRIMNTYDKSIFRISKTFFVVTIFYNAESGTIPTESGTIPTEDGTIPTESGTVNHNKKQQVLELLQTDSAITQNAASEILGIPLRTVKRIFSRLIADDIIERVGDNRTGYWVIKK